LADETLKEGLAGPRPVGGSLAPEPDSAGRSGGVEPDRRPALRCC